VLVVKEAETMPKRKGMSRKEKSLSWTLPPSEIGKSIGKKGGERIFGFDRAKKRGEISVSIAFRMDLKETQRSALRCCGGRACGSAKRS